MKKLIAIAAIAGFALSAAPASAFWFGSDADITVTTSNSAEVMNVVSTTASTGGNSANGAKAKSYTEGGDVKWADDSESGKTESTTTGGNGGIVMTGEAIATSAVGNTVNSNDIKVKASCGCTKIDDVTVTTGNTAGVGNVVATKAKTGKNSADAGKAKSTTEGGSVKGGWSNETGSTESTTTGGMGGLVVTGPADALTTVVNVVNTNTVRIRR